VEKKIDQALSAATSMNATGHHSHLFSIGRREGVFEAEEDLILAREDDLEVD